MKTESLADKLFGKKPVISDSAIDAISHPDQITDDKPFPVQVLPYLEKNSHMIRYQLDSRGIRVDQGLDKQPGIQRISTNRFRKLSRGIPAEVHIEKDPQADMSVRVVAHSLPGGRAILRTDLLPNEHGIKGSGSRHYLINEADLEPVYREPHPRVEKVGGVNFGMLVKNAIVDIINK
jgi:hypothetical protein